MQTSQRDKHFTEREAAGSRTMLSPFHGVLLTLAAGLGLFLVPRDQSSRELPQAGSAVEQLRWATW